MKKTKGGVLLPEKSQAKVLEGTVVAIGPGMRDKVSFSNWSQLAWHYFDIVVELRYLQHFTGGSTIFYNYWSYFGNLEKASASVK